MSIISALDEISEYALSLDEFLNPVTYKGRSAVEILLCRLIMLEPGTFETHPEMGVGLVSKYRNMPSTEVDTLRSDIQSQISTYMPWLYGVEVKTETLQDGKLRIAIKASDELFALTYSKNTASLKTEQLTLDSFA